MNYFVDEPGINARVVKNSSKKNRKVTNEQLKNLRNYIMEDYSETIGDEEIAGKFFAFFDYATTKTVVFGIVVGTYTQYKIGCICLNDLTLLDGELPHFLE